MMLNDAPNRSAIIPRETWWWLGLALLMLLASWLYLRGYNVSLPFIEHVDEPQHLLAAQAIIDTGSARPVFHDAAPPGMSRLNYLLLKHAKPPDAHHGTMLPALRLITIAAWMAVVVILSLLGSLVSHPLAGLMAAAIWIVNPWVVQRAHFALPDGYLTLFTLLSLWLALVGFEFGRRSYCTAAVYSIMLAILFKSQALFIAPIIVLLPLLGIRNGSFSRADALQQAQWNCVRFAVFLFWLLLLHPTLESSRIPYWPAADKPVIPSLHIIWGNLSQILETFQPLYRWLAIALFGLLLLRYRIGINARRLLLLVLVAIVFLIGMSLFGRQALRQFFVLGAILAVLYACSLHGLTVLVEKVLARQNVVNEGVRKLLIPASLAVMVALGLYPAFRDSDAIAHDFTLRDRRNDLMSYMDSSAPPGIYVSNYDNHKTFNRAWGGYTGLHDFPWHKEYSLLADRPIEDWRALGVEYAILPYPANVDDPHIYYPDETVLLKSYPPDPNFRGPDMVVLRLYPMQHQHGGELGSIQLVGYDINGTRVPAGEDIVLRHYWQATSPTDAVYHVNNHLLNDDGEIVAQVDYVPLWDDRRPTTTWDDPEEIMLGREFTLSLPPDLTPGSYQLISGLYDPVTGHRLTSATGEDSMTISLIEVVPKEA